MIKRLFWIAIGAGLAIFVVNKVRKYLRKSSPQALSQRVADDAGNLTTAARDFTIRLRAAMAERETELRDTLGLSDQPESDDEP
jgi:DNA-directed RNA polymerase specialized sigma subunit